MLKNNNGWGLKEMLILSAILLFFLLLVSILINNLYKGLEKNEWKNNPPSTNTKTYTYKEVEENLKDAALKYYKNHKEESLNIILSDFLMEQDYLTISKMTSKNDICEGYVLIEEEKLTSYISCSNYKTEGY